MASFEMIVLGCSGGPRETNLSGYLLTPAGQNNFICLDAGSLISGLEIAGKKGHFGPLSFIDILKNHVKAYLISHSHLDHVLGLIVGSQEDSPKRIYGVDVTINSIRDHLFNGSIWPNYGNEGTDPIGHYQYHRLNFQKKTPIDHTEMHVEAFLLCHSKHCPSTCFLVEWKGEYLLYFGDTAADGMHGKFQLKEIWKRVAPLVRAKKLKGILLECSYPSGQTGAGVEAHLDTTSMQHELKMLSEISESSLSGLKVVVTHRKDSFQKDRDSKQLIEEELTNSNTLGIHYIFPTQGEKILF